MKLNKILLLIFIVGISAAFYLSLGRFQTESHYKNYEITMDIEEIKKTAATEGKALTQALTDWKEVGVNSVTITEATINSLKMNNDYKVRTSYEGYDLVVQATPEGIEFVENGLKEVLLGDRKMTRRSDTELLIEGLASDFGVKYDIVRDYAEKKVATAKIGTTSKLEEVGLGYVMSEIEAANQTGFPIRFRPVYMEKMQDAKKSIDRFIRAVKEYSGQSYAIFFGDTVLGTDTEMKYLSDALKENGIAVAMIETGVQREHLEQNGLKPLVQDMDFQAVRVFSTWNYVQKRYDYEMPFHHHGQEVISTFYRAITERNIRVIFFRPFITKGHDLISDYPVYKQRFADLERRLANPHGIHNVNLAEGERLQTMPNLRMRPAFQMLVAFAVIACFLIIVDNLVKVKALYLYILFALAAAPTALVHLLQIRLKLFNTAFGLASTILFAVLSVQFVLAYSKDNYDKKHNTGKGKAFVLANGYLVAAMLISLLGAAAVTAFYASSHYLLELDVFKGVKISQLLPIVIVIFVCLHYFGNDILGSGKMTGRERAISFLNMNVKFWHAMVAAVLLGAVALLLIRSGHESGIEPANAELFIRNMLEEFLPARPRNKAFLFGYPGLIMLFYLAYQRRYKLAYPVLAIMAAVGQANILNTFSHIRTPLYLSLWRLLFEFLFSAVFAAGYIIVVELGAFVFKKVQEKIKE